MLGVSNIAIPCNTAHYFYDDIQAATKVPVIHMVEETIRYIKDTWPEAKKIGMIGTDGTIQAGNYQRACERYGIELIVPESERQKEVMSLIYDDIKYGKPGDRAKFDHAYDDLMKKGCDAIILACTEISVFKDCNEVPANCVDAMDILVKEAVLRSGAEYLG